MKFFILGVAVSSLLWAAIYFWLERPKLSGYVVVGPDSHGVITIPGGMGGEPTNGWGKWQKNDKGEEFRVSRDGLSTQFK